MEHLKKLSKYYKASALMWFNICVCFVLTNVALLVFFSIKDSLQDSRGYNPVSRKYGSELIEKVYPELDREQVDRLLNESWSRPYVYEPFTLFKESPYRGTYVNVDEDGFRTTVNQGPWPPDADEFNIFLFGGSTAFGYGVPDDSTVASFLQRCLGNALARDIRVYNFGRGHYYSSQERILMQELLVSGCVPNLAIFLDGLNEFYHYYHPFYSESLKRLVEGKTPLTLDRYLIDAFPMARLARFFANRPSTAQPKSSPDDKSLIAGVIHRYLGNKKIIEAVSAAHGFHSVFVWQPIPSYKYDLTFHLFAGSDFAKHTLSEQGYRYMVEYTKKNDLDKNFLWCADIQENLREPLYVDQAHYSAKMCRILAETIAGSLLRDKNEYFVREKR